MNSALFYQKKGFSLIEALVVILAFTIIIGSGVQLFTNLIRHSQKTSSNINLKQEGEAVISKLTRLLVNAKEILEAELGINCDHTNRSSLTIRDLSQNLVTFTCVYNGPQVVSIAVNGQNLINPNNNYVIQSCQFSCYKDNYNESFAVDFSFTLVSIEGKSLPFSTQAVLRNTEN